MLQTERIQIYETISTPTATMTPESQSLYEYWVQKNMHGGNAASDSDPFPGITVPPEYQKLYEYWVQNRLKTEEPKSFSEQISSIRQDRSAMNLITGISIFFILVGVLLILSMRRIRENLEQEKSRMTEHAEGRIKQIILRKTGDRILRCGIIEYTYRGVKNEKEHPVSNSIQEGQSVTVLLDPSDLDTIRIDGQEDSGEIIMKVIAGISLAVGTILFLFAGL